MKIRIITLVSLLALRLTLLSHESSHRVLAKSAKQKTEQALFAAGCFWKVQHVFSKIPGVIRTRVGYSGGSVHNPSYNQVCRDNTGHTETVLVEYDPKIVGYRKLLEIFWANHDPTTPDRQGPDIGSQYRSVVFYTTTKQLQEATKYKQELEQTHRFSTPIVTLINPAGKFYEAEEYHQNYYEKHGAKKNLRKLPNTYWKGKLDPHVYKVTRCSATEAPFTGKYWNQDKNGVYKCSNCNGILFSSKDKFNSGTGWPSFTEAQKDSTDTHLDTSDAMVRTEVVCSQCGAHLGHVFDDGPRPSGKRYCINSASLDFEKEPSP